MAVEIISVSIWHRRLQSLVMPQRRRKLAAIRQKLYCFT